ncbi:MAG: hypothetical protein AVO35_00965 [Candidatus Aegiribacteria sp. MLS_C]|nr:MAG: hypothetical protein AVO35_00965 [Candidatus Aegiribacteria sp. MLS_C]
MKKALLLLLPAVFSLCTATGYGRNKVQVEREDWWEIRGSHFTIYFPVGGEVPAETLLVHTERELAELSEEFGYMPEDPIPMILYVSPGTFRQTDINPYEISQTVGGFTEFYKGRVVVPFTGYWSEFRHVVSHEINHAYIYDMLYRRSLLNIITGGTPLWMMEGLAEYTSLGWDAASEAEFRDMVIANQIVPIDQLSRRSDYLVYREGQAIYHFIVERYGREKYREFVRHINARAASDYASRDMSSDSGVRRGSGDPFKAVFGMSVEQFSEKFMEWARETYWSELACRESPGDIGNALYRDEERVAQLNTVISSDGRLIAGVEYHHAHFAVTVRSAITGEVEERPFVSGGIQDASVSPLYRVCSFSPSGDSLAVAVQYLRGDRLRICSDGRHEDLPFEMDIIRDPSWSSDGRYVTFAGMVDGILDIYLWDLQQHALSRVSDDIRGERDLSWSDGGILCAVEEGPNKTCVLEYGIDGTFRTLLEDTSEVRYPMHTDDGIVILSNREGYPDLYLLDEDSGDLNRLTALYRTIESPSMADSSRIMTFVSSDWSGMGVYLGYDVTDRRVVECSPGSYDVSSTGEDERRASPPGVLPEPGREAGLEGSRTDTGTPVSAGVAPAGIAEDEIHGVEAAEGVHTRTEPWQGLGGNGSSLSMAPYSPRLSVDYASAMASYDSYLGIAGYTQIILSDILAQHQVVVNTNLNGSSLSDVDIALLYGYLPNRTDYIFGLMRESYRYIFKFSDGHYEEVRDVDMGGFAQARYPFSPSFRLSGTIGYRKLSRTGTWNSTADVDEDIFSIEGGLVFDNALWGAVGPRVGSRLSLAGEYAPPISGSADYFTLLMDLRHYLWVSSRVTLAARLALGSSWGSDGQVFFLGGAIPHRLLWGEVDTINELLGFYTNYGDMLRGYDYASVQGRRYGILSLEMRVPFVNTLALDAPLPITITNGRGAFFIDLGTAFNEFDSFRGVSTDGGFHLQDLKLGIGLGYRFNLGYFLLKHDIAWNTDLRGISQRPAHYFTLGAEF